jgi:hypothetical protein
MRFVLAMVLAGLVALPQSVNAQGDQRTEQEPALDLEWLEGSDLQWLQWLLEVEQDVAPERPTWPPRPPPLSEGSWLRLEVDFAGMRVVPRPPPRPPPEVPEYGGNRWCCGYRCGRVGCRLWQEGDALSDVGALEVQPQGELASRWHFGAASKTVSAGPTVEHDAPVAPPRPKRKMCASP